MCSDDLSSLNNSIQPVLTKCAVKTKIKDTDETFAADKRDLLLECFIEDLKTEKNTDEKNCIKEMEDQK